MIRAVELSDVVNESFFQTRLSPGGGISELQVELEHQQGGASSLKSIRQKQIVNRVNALHYQGVALIACLRHRDHERCLLLKASPDPATVGEVSATWIKDNDFPVNLAAFDLVKIILPSNHSVYEVEPATYHLSERGLVFSAPETCTTNDSRKQVRFPCMDRDVTVSLMQNAVSYCAHLLDYSVKGLLIDLESDQTAPLSWLNQNASAMLIISSPKGAVYSGQVRLICRGQRQYLLTPNSEPTPRYMPKEYRTHRQQVVPSPDLRFEHPITGRKQTLKVCDLSNLGFSVYEEKSQATLIPGLMLRNAQILLANNILLTCVTQVVYSSACETNANLTKVGFAILDISVEDHLRLTNLVQQAQDPSAYISNQVNLDDLFEFFFETGFLYPDKYAEIAKRREEIFRTYQLLYEKGADIGRHFVYQQAGQILGHFSKIRVFRKTWFCQHHAALNSHHAGLRVVRAISEYINDCHHLNPANIQFIIGYYRAANRFPRRYFGDYVASLQDPRKTSLDCLSYIHEARRFNGGPALLEQGWTMEEAKASDIVEFNGYYQKISGGLLPVALDITPEHYADQTLTEEYQKYGLQRQRTIYAMRLNGVPKILIDMQFAEFGVNLSEITNSITAYMIDPDRRYFSMLQYAIFQLAKQNDKLSSPVMVFPCQYIDQCGFEPDKEYTLWALNVPDGIQSYMQWMNKFCR